MKKVLSLILASLCAVSALASCAVSRPATASSASDYAGEAWLRSRIGDIPDGVTVGTADSLGIDMSAFEDDGYIIRADGGNVVLCGKNEVGLDMAVRSYAKSVKYGRPISDKTYHEGYRVKRLTIAGRDISEYTVVYTHTVTPSIRDTNRTLGNGELAAKEFVKLITRATGIVLPTVERSDAVAGVPVITFEAVEDENEYPETGFEYEVKDGDLHFIGGGAAAGVTNAVYYFLEKECGWKNLTYGDHDLLESEHVDVPEGVSVKYGTMFNYFLECQNFSDEPMQKLRKTYYGRTGVAGHGLSSKNYLSPEYLSASDLPCFSDGEIIENCIENVKADIQSNLDSGKELGRDIQYIDLGQPDLMSFCQCKECKKVFKEEGAYSGTILRFSNTVSEAVDEEYPGLRYAVFAYGKTQEPPALTKPNGLIDITYCLDGSCFCHALGDEYCSGVIKYHALIANGYWFGKKDLAEWILKWRSMCDHVKVWYYVMDGGLGQYNTLDVLYRDFQFFREHGIEGVFVEAEYYGMGVGRFHHTMTGYMQHHPGCTYDDFMRELKSEFETFYGKGTSEVVSKVASVFNETAKRSGHGTCWCSCDLYPTQCDYDYIGSVFEDISAELDGLIDDADSFSHEKRLKELSLMLIYEGVSKRYYNAKNAGDTAEMARLGEYYEVFLDRLVYCGYDPEKFKGGITFYHSFADTIDEEYLYFSEFFGKNLLEQ